MKNLINLSRLTLLGLGLMVVSCTNESIDDALENNAPRLIEKYFQGEQVLVEPVGDGIFKLDGSDILLTLDQVSDTPVNFDENPTPDKGIDLKLGLPSGVRKWPNNTVIYVLDQSLTNNQIEVTRNSMQEWTNKTNVRFKERTNENYYVTIVNNRNSCNCGSAYVGVNGTQGRINIGTRTSEVVMIHEIGHTLGFIHEQTRSDRDDHVIIKFENIQDGAESQFRKNTRSQNIGPFDIESTMMYGAYTFSKNGRPTITLLDGSLHPRRGPRLSAGDIAATNQVYPGDGGDGGNGGGDTDTCVDVDEWVRGQRYSVGDRVTYQGFLYERDFSRWNRIKECDTTTPSTDICEGIAVYDRSRRYSLGDKVTFRGSLYEVVEENGRLLWKNQGQCGS